MRVEEKYKEYFKRLVQEWSEIEDKELRLLAINKSVSPLVYWREQQGATEKSIETKKCPRCGRELKIKRATRGQHNGKEFWACTGFRAKEHPCDYVENIVSENNVKKKDDKIWNKLEDALNRRALPIPQFKKFKDLEKQHNGLENIPVREVEHLLRESNILSSRS